MHYAEFDPAPAVAHHVSCYWGFEADAGLAPGTPHQVLPDGCISLIAARSADGSSRAIILGPRAEPLVVPLAPGARYWGVRFWPDSGGSVLGLDPVAIAGTVVAPIVTPEWAASLARGLASCRNEDEVARVSNEALRAPVAAAPAPDEAIRRAVVGIVATRGEIAIAELAAGVGLGPRQLERRFRAAVGLTPKRYARIRRMRSALSHLLDPAPRTWSEVAAEHGFADHSHLVRETVDLAGMTPTELAQRVRSISHGRVRP